MQNYKKESIQLIKELKENSWVYEKEKKFLHNLGNRYGQEEAKIKQSFNKCSKSYRVAMFINYRVNKSNHFGNATYSQIAAICNCSWQLVAKVVKKMVKAGLITHELNKTHKSNLKRNFKKINKCNPFKWIFKWLKVFTGELQNLFKKSKGWIKKIPGAKLNLKYTPPKEEIEWFDWDS
jgi:predicted transcriptional regulator